MLSNIPEIKNKFGFDNGAKEMLEWMLEDKFTDINGKHFVPDGVEEHEPHFAEFGIDAVSDGDLSENCFQVSFENEEYLNKFRVWLYGERELRMRRGE